MFNRKVYGKKYYLKNRLRLLAQKKIYHQKTRTIRLKKQRERYKKAQKERLEYAKTYRLNNLERLRKRARERYWENPERFKKLERNNRRKNWTALKELVLQKFNGECKECKITDIRVLQIDHVKGDGHKDRKNGLQGVSLLRAVLKDTQGRFQLLCANCNWIKRVENEERKQRI